ncbi:BamA/TamA family outer membrane protein [Salinibacter altiplanensis]|uniref:BamA/TamA family outer membrane protein n=2 Tax=Salinibacter altiplanensis TaxID=1803181 RepID=UPI000C9EFE9E|nr:BamA/TamA family outer membrane protein [Salinibacter altiplanensis]
MPIADYGIIGRVVVLGGALAVSAVLGPFPAEQKARGQTTTQPERRGAVADSTSGRREGRDTSRAGRWREVRRRKAQSMEEHGPTFVQRATSFVTNIGGAVVPHRLILDVPQLEVADFHPVFGGLDGDAGTTAGVLYAPAFWTGEGRLAEAEVLGSLRGYYGAGARFGTVSEPYMGYAYARYHHRPREGFYGVGADSRVDTEAGFRLNQGVVGGLLGWAPRSSVLLGGHLSYQANRYGTGRGDRPTVAEQFGATLPGVGTDMDYLMLGAFFELDVRDAPYTRAFGHRFAPTKPRLRGVSLDASRGFYLASEVTHNVSMRGQDVDFTRFTLDVREFMPISEGLLHGFSFRQFASVTHSGDGRVPFYRLQSVGGARSLRGYPSGRFRDRNVLLANAEVRCQIWHWIDMAVFADAGHVFRTFREVHFADPRVGYGLGFRIKNEGKTLGRVDVARGQEGWELHLDLGSLF